jgi:regulator of replication initiation timing
LQDRLANLQTERESVAQKENESSAECTRLRDENQQLKDRLDVAERSLQTELKSGKQEDSEELIRLREASQVKEYCYNLI